MAKDRYASKKRAEVAFEADREAKARFSVVRRSAQADYYDRRRRIDIANVETILKDPFFNAEKDVFWVKTLAWLKEKEGRTLTGPFRISLVKMRYILQLRHEGKAPDPNRAGRRVRLTRPPRPKIVDWWKDGPGTPKKV